MQVYFFVMLHPERKFLVTWGVVKEKEGHGGGSLWKDCAVVSFFSWPFEKCAAMVQKTSREVLVWAGEGGATVNFSSFGSC